MSKREFLTIGQLADMEKMMNKLWASDVKKGQKFEEARKRAKVSEEEREF